MTVGAVRVRRGRGVPELNRLRRASEAVGLIAACVAVAALLVHGGFVALALLGLVAGVSLFVLVGVLGFRALLLWLPMSALLYPFVRTSANQALVTFDRTWIAAVAIWAFSVKRTTVKARETRALTAVLVWLVASYGVRSLSGGSLLLGNIAGWIDAIALPVLLYAVCERVLDSTERIWRVVRSLAIGGGVLALIGISEKVVGFQLASRSGGVARFDPSVGTVRISGPYTVPETYALTLLVCFAATLAWLQLGERRHRLFIAALAVLELAAIGLTLFRAAWISAVVVLIASFGFRPRQVTRAAVAVVLVGLALYLVSGPLLRDSTVKTRISNVQNVQGRLATYGDGIELFKRAPVFGVGPRKFVSAHLELGASSYEGVQAVSPAHSSFILLLAEQGAVGFLPFAAAILAAWRLVRRQRREAVDRIATVLGASMVGAAASYLILSASLSMLPYGPSNAVFAVFLGVIAAQLNLQRASGSGIAADAR